MKTSIKCLVFFAAIFLTSCGISDKDKDYMNIVLENKLSELYSEHDITAMFLSCELTKLEKNEGIYGERTAYRGVFSCQFENEADEKVRLYGDVEFDKNKRIALTPPRYGNNKLAIDIYMILIGSKEVENRDKNKYVLDEFVNRNNYNNLAR